MDTKALRIYDDIDAADPKGTLLSSDLPTVRPMRRGDIHAAEKLFSAAFRKNTPPAGAELRAYIEQVFFGGPDHDAENGSIVYDDGKGGITSVIFAIPMTFRVNERLLVARLLCAFASDGKTGSSGAARLARHVRAARQDMCFSDTSSAVSADHCLAAGGIILPIQSLEWHKAFRPLTAAALRLGRRLRFAASPLTLFPLSMADRLLRRWKPGIRPVAAKGCVAEIAGLDAFLQHAESMTERFAIRPEWTKAEFDWLLGLAQLNKSLGKLQCGTVSNNEGRIIGAFLFFGQENRTANILNVVCDAGHELDVTRQMFHCLDGEGYARASGMAQPFLMNAFYRQNMMTFKHRGYFCISTRHDDLKQAALRDDIYIGGLVSESWSRMLTDF